MRGWRTASERETLRDGELLGGDVGPWPDERFSDELPPGPVPLRPGDRFMREINSRAAGVEPASHRR